MYGCLAAVGKALAAGRIRRGASDVLWPRFIDGAVQMTVPAATENLRMTRRWLRVQSLVAMALAIALLAFSPVAAYSSIFGSLAAFLPALLFALIVAPRFGNDSSAFLRAAVLAEVVKWLVTALLCIAVFVWVEPLAAGWFFTGMIAVFVAGWLGLFLSN
jgi:F0F1-type ATP synthase assembly protein I